MGFKNREFTNDETSSLSEALLFATMCIIGLPVDVHVKDGSVYSGIFHTASVENEYGIVLKKARMTKKGKSDANVANGAVIDTLVILSGDLVQVVAKGVLLPADGVAGNMAGDNTEAVVGTVPSYEHLVNEAKKSTKCAVHKKKVNQTRSSVQAENGFALGFMPTKAGREHEGRKSPTNQTGNALGGEYGKRDGISSAKVEEASGASGSGRQAGDDRSLGEQDNYKENYGFHREKSADEVHCSSSILDSLTQVKPIEDVDAKMTSKLLPNGASSDSAPAPVKPYNQCCERPTSADTSSSDAVSSGVSTSSNPTLDVTSESSLSSLATSTEVAPSQNPESNRISKEFKLNPGAKIFSPSLANPRSVTPPVVPTVASMSYMPNNTPAVPVAAAQPEVGFGPVASHSSVPVKLFPYGNLTAGNGGSGSQFSQPILGHMASRTQPLRYSNQYNTVQAGPAYVHPNSQAVMVGRLGGQLIYVHPVSHDLVQGAAAISPVSARPLLTPHQVQFPKHQGSAAGQALQLCVPPPFIASGQQPYALPSNVPLMQPPFPTNRPIPVPGSNGLYNTKFS